MTDAETLEPAEAPKKTRKALAPPSPAEGLSARAEAARERVEALERERNEATLRGDAFDHAKLRAALDEVEAIEAAQGEALRRERAAQAEAARAGLGSIREQAAAHEAARCEAIEEAEALARGLADALIRAEARRADLGQSLHALDARMPADLQKAAQLERMSRALSAVLLKVAGSANLAILGDIKLNPGSIQAGDSWLHFERHAKAALANILETPK